MGRAILAPLEWLQKPYPMYNQFMQPILMAMVISMFCHLQMMMIKLLGLKI